MEGEVVLVEEVSAKDEGVEMDKVGDPVYPIEEDEEPEPEKPKCCSSEWWQACCLSCYRKIPPTLLSWQRWLTFILIFSILCVTFAFLPYDTSVLDEGVDKDSVVWYSMLPPLLALTIAACFKLVVAGLFMGVFVGSMIAYNGNPWSVVNKTIAPEVLQEFQAYILGFTLAVVGLVYMLRRCNGLDSMVHHVMKLAKGAYGTRVTASFSCLLFFFDDYSNVVLSGSVWQKPFRDVRISVQKLAFIVDSTAAPMASISLISTWISYELGIIAGAIDDVNAVAPDSIKLSAYEMFLKMLPLRFYCFTALITVFACAFTGRDYGPMLAAERAAALQFERFSNSKGGYEEDEAVEKVSKKRDHSEPDPSAPKSRWHLAVIPLLLLFCGVAFGMLIDGWKRLPPERREELGEFSIWNAEIWKDGFGEALSPFVLFWVTIMVIAIAFGMIVYQEANNGDEVIRAFLFCVPTMVVPCVILVLAWSIKSVCIALQTAEYIASLIGDQADITFLPAVIFLLAIVTALSTGTSWGTMGILLPIAFPLVFNLADKDPSTSTGLTPSHQNVFFLAGAAVLDGAVMGDHISPISDTTVLTSTASGCPIYEHVLTQIPYACVSGGLALVAGYLAVALGMPFWAYILIALFFIPSVFMIFGSKLPQPSEIHKGEFVIDTGKPGPWEMLWNLCPDCITKCRPCCVSCGLANPTYMDDHVMKPGDHFDDADTKTSDYVEKVS